MIITRTDVTIKKPIKENYSNFKGWAKIVLDDILMISGIQLFEYIKDGNLVRYIRFPERNIDRNFTDGEKISIAIVNTNDPAFREMITNTVFDEYDSQKNKMRQYNS